MRRSFEQANAERANTVAAQFRSEFQRRGQEVVGKVESIAASDTVAAHCTRNQPWLLRLRQLRGRSSLAGHPAASRFPRTGGPRRHDSLFRAVAGKVRLSRAGDPRRGWLRRSISETRGTAGWLDPRPVCGARRARRRATALSSLAANGSTRDSFRRSTSPPERECCFIRTWKQPGIRNLCST